MAKEVNLHCMYCGERLIKSEESSRRYDCPKCDFKITDVAVLAIAEHRELMDHNKRVMGE